MNRRMYVVYSGLSGAIAVAFALSAAACKGALGPLDGDRGPLLGAPGETPQVGYAPMRRLTRVEYNNTVRDLLGDQTRPADVFEADEAVGGFESNNVVPVSPTAIEQYMAAAEALAAAARLEQLVPCEPATGDDACARSFIASFGRRAYRRPLTAGEVERLMALYAARAATSGFAGGVRLVTSAVLQSPWFVYRPEASTVPEGEPVAPLSGYELASRLSYFLWASMPDDVLLDAAEQGKLTTADGLRAQAERLLADGRARDGVRSFFRQWLGVDRVRTTDKNETKFPSFTPEVREAMIEEALRFGEYAASQGEGALETLFTAGFSFLNGPLADFYGVPGTTGVEFRKVELPTGQRAGVLTLGAQLSVNAHPNEGTPILRGKFIREQLLCQPLPPPPPNIPALPAIDPSVSTRERFALHTAAGACAGCHTLIDPPGFMLLHYDAVGRWMDEDGGGPIDTSGELTAAGDANGRYDGAAELGRGLAASGEARRCMTRQVLRYALGRPDGKDDASSLERAEGAFASAKLDLHALLLAVATSDAFRYRRPTP